MDVGQLFQHFEETIASKARAAGIFLHRGDRGEAREEAIREFLGNYLPKKYGVTSGEVVTRGGTHSHAADVIIYDSLHCPVLYVGENRVLPIEGVYGIIEVKSSLSKQEFIDAARKIESFKRLAPRELSVIQTREYLTVHQPSRPFGAVLGLGLADNSLDSLRDTFLEINAATHDVNFFTNLIAVLGAGLLFMEKVDWSLGAIGPILDTDEFVQLVLTVSKRAARGEPEPDLLIRATKEDVGARTFGRFFVYLLMMLERLKLAVPDLGQYLDPSLPMTIHRES